VSGGGTPGRPRLSATARTRLAVTLVALLVAFVILTIAVGAHATGHLDARAIVWVGKHRTDAAIAVARGFAAVGSWWLTGPLVVVLAALLFAFHRRREAAYLLVTMAASAALNSLLKVLFRRHPPLDAPEGVRVAQFSYPSGHTMSATAFAAALVFIAWPTRWRTPVLVAATVYAAAMGITRFVLAVHWPSDVAGAWLMGTAVAIAVRLAMTQIPGETESPAAAWRPAAAAPVDVVFLDWGGTLMVDDGSQSGPMAGWPEVTAVEGAQEALEALRPDYRLVVATNADDSGARDVRAALFRVGLDGLVDDVVSSRDIGARKPDSFFYRAALLRSGRGGVTLAAERAVMVGDSWPNDVAGARAAGLRAVWFNPGRAPRPAGAEPPDAEIARLADLPAALAALQGGAGVRRGRGEGDADPGPGG
jgi:membrane-associated phospholipid phosphatase/phosphoglycolate phosphatase-like HAD superfamily hydrolase